MPQSEPPVSVRPRVRLALGFASIPIIDALTAFTIHPFVWPIGPDAGSRWADRVDAAMSFAAGVTIVAIVMTCVGAIPTVLWLAHHRRLSLKSLMIAAVTVGNGPFVVAAGGALAFYFLGAATWSDVRYTLFDGPLGAVRATSIGSVVGAISGFAFWVIAVAGGAVGEDSVDRRTTTG